MKCLFLDAVEYAAKKPKLHQTEHLTDCLVVLVTFESGDSNKKIGKLVQEIEQIAKEFKTDKILLGPFAHLSSDLLAPVQAKELLKLIANKLKCKFELLVSEFGVEKGLLLNVRPGDLNIRFRAF